MKKLFKKIFKFVIIAIVLLAVLKACFGKDDKPEPKQEIPYAQIKPSKPVDPKQEVTVVEEEPEQEAVVEEESEVEEEVIEEESEEECYWHYIKDIVLYTYK